MTPALLWLCAACLTFATAAFTAEAENNKLAMTSINVRIAGKLFAARLENNETAAAFAAMLPLTLTMSDLNDNEKVIDLPEKLPGAASNPGTIRTGDLMIWSSRSLVLFYKTFPTPYSYMRLGRIDDPTGLAAAVGSGNVTVTFEKQ